MQDLEQRVRTPLHPSEIIHHEQNSLRCSILSLCSNALGVGLLLYSLFTGFNDPRKIVYLVSSGLAGYIGLSASNISQTSRRKVLDYSDIADSALQNYVYASLDPSQGHQGAIVTEAIPMTAKPEVPRMASQPVENASKTLPSQDNDLGYLHYLRGLQEGSRQVLRVDPQTRTVNKAISPKPKAKAEDPIAQPYQLRYFPWDEIKTRRNKHAHFILAGGTGDGKTTLAQWLAYQYPQDGELIIGVVPHYRLGDFGSADLILGAGRNYGYDARPFKPEERDDKGKVTQKQEGEPTLKFQDILEGRGSIPTVCQFVQSLYQEMNRRFDSSEYLAKTGTLKPMTVFLDEYPAWSKLPGVSDCVGQLIREARKVGIRIVILTQGLEVKTLGFEGEGSLRDSATVIRLGEFAVKHVKYLINSAMDQDEKRALGALADRFQGGYVRPGMVDDDPCNIPDLSEFSQWLESITPVFTNGKPQKTSKPETEEFLIETYEAESDIFDSLEVPLETNFDETSTDPQKDNSVDDSREALEPREQELYAYLLSKGTKTIRQIVNAKSRKDRGGYKTDEIRTILEALEAKGWGSYDRENEAFTSR